MSDKTPIQGIFEELTLRLRYETYKELAKATEEDDDAE